MAAEVGGTRAHATTRSSSRLTRAFLTFLPIPDSSLTKASTFDRGSVHDFTRACRVARVIRGTGVIQPPNGMGGFEFATLSALRAAQLIRGCVPMLESTDHHKPIIVAQMEVGAGHIGHAGNADRRPDPGGHVMSREGEESAI